MKTSIRKHTYKAIYRLLNYVTPLKTDCGLLCGAACCLSAEADMGIYLLPGEEKLFTRSESWLSWEIENAQNFDFPESWRGKIYFIRCNNAPGCPRDQRPLQCRFFPLAPHFDLNGKLVLIYYSADLPYICPLITNKTSLEPSFIKAVHTVWRRLIKDPLIYDLVRYDSAAREPFEVQIVYPAL